MVKMPTEKTQLRTTLTMIPAGLLFGVLIPMGALWAGSWIDSLGHFPRIPPFPLNWLVGVIVSASGLAIALGSIYQLYKEGHGLPWGDVTPPSQSTQLVTTGLYAYTRNPMVLGYAIYINGWGWLFQSLSTALILPAIFLTLLYIWLANYEEPKLEERFGEAYTDYKKRTPRLIPRPWKRSQNE